MGSIFSKPSIKLEKKWENILGRGSFGVVYKAQYDKRTIAVKVLNLHQIQSDPEMDRYRNIDRNELVPLFKSLHNDNIISLITCETHHYPELWIAMELCDTTLEKYILYMDEDNSNMPDTHIFDILWQASNGVYYLHRRNIIHRDIRPDNILIVIRNSLVEVKISDFSVCNDVDAHCTSVMTKVFGNKYWLAPELLSSDGVKLLDSVCYRRPIDTFSLGQVFLFSNLNKDGRAKFYELCCGMLIKRGIDVCKHFDSFWKSSYLKNKFLPLLNAMLNEEVSERPTMEYVTMNIPQNYPNVVHLSTYTLDSNYKAHPYIGLGSENCNFFLLGCDRTDSLVLFQFQNERFSFKQSKRQYDGAHIYHKKYVAGDMLILRSQEGVNPTRCLDSKMHLIHQHYIKAGMVLVGVLSAGQQMIYSEKIGGGFQLNMLNHDVNHQCITVFKPPTNIQWGEHLSVCMHPESIWLAVCESQSKTLTIFNEDDSHAYCVSLDYQAGAYDAAVCTGRLIIIRQEDGTTLHVHSWTGQKLTTIDLKDYVKLGDEETKIYSISVSNGKILYTAVGKNTDNDQHVTSLHAFEIRHLAPIVGLRESLLQWLEIDKKKRSRKR